MPGSSRRLCRKGLQGQERAARARSSRPGWTTAGDTGGPLWGRGSWQVGCVQTRGRGQSRRPPRAGRMQPPHVTGRGGAAVGRRDGGPGGPVWFRSPCAGAPEGDAAERVGYRLQGSRRGSQAGHMVHDGLQGPGPERGYLGQRAPGREPRRPDAVRTGGERQGTQTESGEAGLGRSAGRTPGSQVGKPSKEEGDISQPRDELTEPIRQNLCAGTPQNGPDRVLYGGAL